MVMGLVENSCPYFFERTSEVNIERRVRANSWLSLTLVVLNKACFSFVGDFDFALGSINQMWLKGVTKNITSSKVVFSSCK